MQHGFQFSSVPAMKCLNFSLNVIMFLSRALHQI